MPTGKYLRGSNDHFIAQGTLGLTMQARIQRAVTLGLNSIRVDTYNSTMIQPFVSAAKQYAAAGIELIPTLLPDISTAKVEQDAYNIGFAYGSAFAAASKGIYVNQKLELGNEEDLNCQNGKDGSGGPWPQDYDDTKYALIRGKLRGLYDGVKKGDPNCVAMIGNSGWQATGFTDRLFADGVRWDVLIVHDYDSFGAIDVPITSGPVVNDTFIDYYAKAYGTPIYLSEIGDNQNPNGSAAQAQAMLTVISKVEALSKKYPIIGWAEYELFDYSDGQWSMLCDHSGNPLPAYGVLQTYIAQTAPPSAAPSPAPAPAPAPAPVPAPAVAALAMSWVSPAGDATPLGGATPLNFAGTAMKNVEVSSVGGKTVNRMVCSADGTGAIGSIDLSPYSDGSLTLVATAWDVAAGLQTTTTPVTKSITIQVKNATPAPAPAPAPAPTPAPSAAGGRTVLVGFYDAPSDAASWLGYAPDFTINNSFQDSGLGKTVEIIAGTKVIVALDLGAQHYNANAADYRAGAAGQYDTFYEATVKSLLPRAADIIGFRIDPEFNLHWGPGDTGASYSIVGPAIYIACWNNLAKFIRQYFPGIPIFFNPNVENGADVTPYWPGGKDVHMGIDAYMAPQWSTTFAHYVGLSVNGLQVLRDFAAKQGAQTFMCEWGDLYPDAAGDLGQMAAWMLANTAGGAYWDSNDALNTTGAGNTSPVLTDAVKKAEFQAAFGGLGPYTGTLFKL